MFERWSELPDDRLIERLDKIGGVPAALRDDRASLLRYLPAVRADFQALERWYIGRTIAPLSTRLLIAAAEGDAFLPPATVREWTTQSRSSEFKLFPGGHFFVQDQPEILAQWLMQQID